MHHRHVSQLYGLYPGNLIHREDKELLAACRVALDRRGNEGTGWCMAWKACLWARLGDGERALKLLKNQLHVTKEENCSLVGGGTYPNMLCAHPVSYTHLDVYKRQECDADVTGSGCT